MAGQWLPEKRASERSFLYSECGSNMSSTKNRFLAVLMSLALPVFSTRAADANNQTVRFNVGQAIEFALSVNPQVLEAREQITEFDHQVRQARSEALPRVEALVSVVANRDPGLLNSPFFSQLLEGPDPIPPEALEPLRFENFIWNFSVRQPVFSFGRVRNAIQAANQELGGIHEDVREEENRISRDVARAC